MSMNGELTTRLVGPSDPCANHVVRWMKDVEARHVDITPLAIAIGGF